MRSGRDHPLLDVLERAAVGSFPEVDGGVEVLAPHAPDLRAVVELTGHSYVMADVSAADIERCRVDGAPVDGFGGCTHPAFLQWLAGDRGEIGCLDAVLVARGTGEPARSEPSGPPERVDLDRHPRVMRSRAHRRDVRVFADARGLVTLGIGLVGRLEISVELTGAQPGRGAGRDLVAAGLNSVERGQLVWAQVAPGNAASLRAFLGAGFVPIGSEVLITGEW